MRERTARCACGSLSIKASGEPCKISVCHCDACQKRTGSAFGVAVFFDRALAVPHGDAQRFVRKGDSGHTVEFHFCRVCGSSVFWYPAFRPALVAIAMGCFSDPLPVPSQAVYAEHQRDWITLDLEPRKG